MTPEELREKVAEAMPEVLGPTHRRILADAALAVVREEMREPSDDMLTAMEGVPVRGELPVERESRAIYAAMLAASPLREPGA